MIHYDEMFFSWDETQYVGKYVFNGTSETTSAEFSFDALFCFFVVCSGGEGGGFNPAEFKSVYFLGNVCSESMLPKA